MSHPDLLKRMSSSVRIKNHDKIATRERLTARCVSCPCHLLLVDTPSPGPDHEGTTVLVLGYPLPLSSPRRGPGYPLRNDLESEAGE